MKRFWVAILFLVGGPFSAHAFTPLFSKADLLLQGPGTKSVPATTSESLKDSLQEYESRRQIVKTIFLSGLSLFVPLPARSAEKVLDGGGRLFDVIDPDTYSALVYTPPPKKQQQGPLPLLIVLHGAGKNELNVWNLANPSGEHAGLAPSLLASGRAPKELADNFVVVAPYSKGKRSFYEEPRSELLQFVNWIFSNQAAGIPQVDPQRVFLFGFSDGATVAVELLTTRRFAGGVICAYGFTGDLPEMALDRLMNIPMWIFHSADDVIFSVSNSDKLVESLKRRNSNDVIRYTRYKFDQEGFTGAVQGHSTGITASKQPDVYKWLLSI